MKTRITLVTLTLILSIAFCNLYSQDTLTGKVVYGDSAKTPLPYSTVKLLDSNNNIIATAATNFDGEYMIPNVNPGTYTLTATTTLPWGNVSISDVFKIILHINGYMQFDSLQKLAADIDGNGIINNTDVNLIMNRLLNINNSFPIGDWVFEEKTITVGSQSKDETQGDENDVEGRETGNEEGDESQPGWQDGSKLISTNRTESINIHNNNVFDIPVSTNQAFDCAGFTLNILIPENIELIGINSNLHFTHQNIKDNLIQIGFITEGLQSTQLKNKQTLINIKVKIKEPNNGFNSDIEILNGSEFTDMRGNKINNLTLNIPSLTNQNTNSINLKSIYPNPVKSFTNISYSVSIKGNISVIISDITGRTCKMTNLGIQQIGNYKREIDCSEINAGKYFLKIINKNDVKPSIETRSIIIY